MYSARKICSRSCFCAEFIAAKKSGDLDSESSCKCYFNSVLEDNNNEEKSRGFYAVESASGRSLYIGKTKKDDHVWIYIVRGEM